MKKTNNFKKIALLVSVATTLSFSQFANAEEVIEQVSVKEVVESEPMIVQAVNPQLRSILRDQKDAQELLNNSDINIEGTLQDLAKYGALNALQDAKNKLDATVKQPSNLLDNDEYGEAREGQQARQSNNSESYASNNQRPSSNQNAKPKVEEVDIKATAVYTLGNVGYAEINYNGTKAVIKKGDKLPNGYTIEALTPLSVIITNGKEKQTLPIVSNSAGVNAPVVGNDNFTLEAPRAN